MDRPTSVILRVARGAAKEIEVNRSREDHRVPKTSKQLVVCINNEGCSVSLKKRKTYVLVRDPVAEKHGQLRIVDESGEDYLYPKALFRTIDDIEDLLLERSERFWAMIDRARRGKPVVIETLRKQVTGRRTTAKRRKRAGRTRRAT
jgi:hypothetical protein